MVDLSRPTIKLPPPVAIYLGGERVPGFLSCGSYNGGGEREREREGFTTYRLSVVIRQPAYARIAITTLGWLLAIGLAIARTIRQWGIKKEKEKKKKQDEGRSGTARSDCVTKVDDSAIVSTLPIEWNWANTTDTIIDVTSRRACDYETSRARNAFNVVTLT